MTDNDVTDDDLAALIELASEATSAFIGGDMHRYFALIEHADDYTLMSPTGGEVASSDISERRINEMARFFQSGEGTLEVIQTYASGDLAVLVAVERQRGVVGDYPAQDWSLRVTLVFRREGSTWQLAHRHADALVHPITTTDSPNSPEAEALPPIVGSSGQVGSDAEGCSRVIADVHLTFESACPRGR